MTAIRAGKALHRIYLRLRHPAAFGVTSGEAGGFDSMRGHKYALLVTFRRSGEAVPTPVWFGLAADGKVYAFTFADTGKVKRLRNEPRALLAPCTARGKPLGPPVEGRARLLPREEWNRAEHLIQANYGFARRMYNLPWRRRTDDVIYVEIVERRL